VARGPSGPTASRSGDAVGAPRAPGRAAASRMRAGGANAGSQGGHHHPRARAEGRAGRAPASGLSVGGASARGRRSGPRSTLCPERAAGRQGRRRVRQAVARPGERVGAGRRSAAPLDAPRRLRYGAARGGWRQADRSADRPNADPRADRKRVLAGVDRGGLEARSVLGARSARAGGRAVASGQGTIRPDGVAKRGRRRRPARAGPRRGVAHASGGVTARAPFGRGRGPRTGGRRGTVTERGRERRGGRREAPCPCAEGAGGAAACPASVGGAGPALSRRTTSAPPFGGRRVRGTATRGCRRRGPPGRSVPAASRGGAVSETVRAPPTGLGTTARRMGAAGDDLAAARGELRHEGRRTVPDRGTGRDRVVAPGGRSRALFRALLQPPPGKLRARAGSHRSTSALARRSGTTSDGRRARSRRSRRQRVPARTTARGRLPDRVRFAVEPVGGRPARPTPRRPQPASRARRSPGDRDSARS